MNTSTIDRSSHSIVGDMYEYHKKTGCDDVAAAVLALAEIVHRLPLELTSTIATGLSAISGLAAGLREDGKALDPEWHGNGDPSPRGPHVSEPMGTDHRDSAASPKAATLQKGNGKSRARGRGDRNHADMQVLELFLPPDETKRLAEFFDSVGIPVTETAKMQQLLTLIVHYVTKIRKEKCTHSHIHTVLKKVGVGTPSDLGARLRDVNRRSGHIDASNGQDVRMTMKGENWIDVELPKRKAQAKAVKK